MKLGIIGGSGLYELEGMEVAERVTVKTPFGDPSDAFVRGHLHGREVLFLPRHGKGHRLLPSEINHRANIYAFKTLGVERVLSVSAVGSLKAEHRPRDLVLPDQYFDRTKRALEHTFFGEGAVAHVGFGEPTCAALRALVAEAARGAVAADPETAQRQVSEGGVYVAMEGPAFSTKAESRVYRGFGFDVIGMTSLGEAKLCREAEICYQSLAMVTDYDCWHETEEAVTVEMVVGHLLANTAMAKKILASLVTTLPDQRTCACGNALQSAILSDIGAIPEATREKLAPIIGRYLA
jgi:5'-methylthioadenosine phosphorylase